jgi:hypothetical protein
MGVCVGLGQRGIFVVRTSQVLRSAPKKLIYGFSEFSGV